MKVLPGEVLQLVEWALREYPDRESELEALDQYINNRCHAVLPDAESSGLSVTIPVSPQEKIIESKEDNSYYQWLIRFLLRVKKALEALDEDEMNFVDYKYWQDMSIQSISRELNRDRRTVFRIRQRTLHKLASRILPDMVFSKSNSVTLGHLK